MKNNIRMKFNEWKTYCRSDSDLSEELELIENSDSEIFERFYRNLEFGTGGLRGIIGAGSNRVNIYTVGQATQAYADYLLSNIENPSVSIAFDSRIKSDTFAHRAAEVFAANNIKVYIYQELMPTPALSFAVRHLNCSGGIVITASHNPAKYNGYKVYDKAGCQITPQTAAKIQEKIEQIRIFQDVKCIPFSQGLAEGIITYIADDTITQYIEAVSSQSLCGEKIDRSISITYTPLNGAGLKCVMRALRENGYSNISTVKEQKMPDGNFPTCPSPNPEIKEALSLGIACATRNVSNLLLATDPDCDRMGVAVKKGRDYILLSGNEMGILLFDYICKQRIANRTMPENPVLIKTVVTTDLVKSIAKYYNVQVIEVLTGFKYIGEQISILESRGEAYRYIFGFEESYGYLSGTYVRDKDGVNASLLTCEMLAYYKTHNMTLLDVLNEIYEKFGYCLNTLRSIDFEGAAGLEQIRKIMNFLRQITPGRYGILEINRISDYYRSYTIFDTGEKEPIYLPTSDVLKFWLIDGTTVTIRPSGTEPKLKVYLSVQARNPDDARQKEQTLWENISKRWINMDDLLYSS